MNKIILFDMDGTLIDSTEAIVESFNYALSSNGLATIDRSKIMELIGYPLDIMLEMLGVEENKVDTCFSSYREHYVKVCDIKTTLLPDADMAVRLASKFAYLGVVTTKSSGSTKELLKHFGLYDYFSVVIGKDDVINPKPSSEPILRALEVINGEVAIQDTFMIGDTILDLQAAQSANINGIGVLCGYGKREKLAKYTKYIYPNSYEAVRFIESL